MSNRAEIKPSELARILPMDESALSRHVDRMCAKGVLPLEADDDRCNHRITVTSEGAAIIRKAHRAWRKTRNKVSRLLGPENLATLGSSLKKLIA